MVLFVGPGGGITLVGVPRGKLLLLELSRDRGVWPDGRGISRHADRLTDIGLGDRRVGCAGCSRRVRQDGPAALTVIPPVVCVWIGLALAVTFGLALAVTFGGAVVGGEFTAAEVRVDDDGVGLSDPAAADV